MVFETAPFFSPSIAHHYLQKGTTIYGREALIINNLGIIEMDDVPERQFKAYITIFIYT